MKKGQDFIVASYCLTSWWTSSIDGGIFYQPFIIFFLY